MFFTFVLLISTNKDSADLSPGKPNGSVQMTGDLKLGNNQVRAWNAPSRGNNKNWEFWRGDITVDGDLILNNHEIKNVTTPKANESDKAANVDFVVNEINNNNANVKQQYKDWVAQSHLISSHKENVFKYLYDTDESASEYNIRVDGFEENFRESAHQNKKAYSITIIKNTDGSNDYRSGISFNIYPLPIGTFTMIFEYYWPESTNVSLSTQGTTVYIHKQVYRAFDTYGKLLVQINNNSKTTPDRITLVIHGRAVVQNPEGYLVIYGIKGWSDSVDPRVYDGLKNEMVDFENNKMKMQVDINMNGKTITGLKDPANNQDAVSKGYLQKINQNQFNSVLRHY